VGNWKLKAMTSLADDNYHDLQHTHEVLGVELQDTADEYL
jgi:hypothetical protein